VRGGLIAFEKEEVVGSFLLGQESSAGFGRVGGVADDEHSGQIHLGQMRGDGGFFVGVLGHGHLIDQSLSRGLKVDQRESFLGFGFLEFHRGIEGGRGLGQGRIGGQARRSGVGIFEDLAIQGRLGRRTGWNAQCDLMGSTSRPSSGQAAP
jgi:hypothetical protein